MVTRACILKEELASPLQCHSKDSHILEMIVFVVDSGRHLCEGAACQGASTVHFSAQQIRTCCALFCTGSVGASPAGCGSRSDAGASPASPWATRRRSEA